MPDLPAPTEAWGLFDASGKFVAAPVLHPNNQREREKRGLTKPMEPGFTIRRVVVTVKEEADG